MRRPYQILWPLLSLFLVRVDLTDLYPIYYGARIIQILDGDTVKVKYGKQVRSLRFSRIDAPEKKQPFLGTKIDAGAESLKCAKKVLRKKSYVLKIEKLDIYGRLLGDLEEVSLELVKAGCVTLYPYGVFSSRNEKFNYLRALARAKRLRKGIWRYGGILQPKLWRKTKLSKRFSHLQKHR